MENSPLHVCRLQPARSELMSALLGAVGNHATSTPQKGYSLLLEPYYRSGIEYAI
jgi:hypothetical protein